jgi:hypothetical protein
VGEHELGGVHHVERGTGQFPGVVGAERQGGQQ